MIFSFSALKNFAHIPICLSAFHNLSSLEPNNLFISTTHRVFHLKPCFFQYINAPSPYVLMEDTLRSWASHNLLDTTRKLHCNYILVCFLLFFAPTSPFYAKNMLLIRVAQVPLHWACREMEWIGHHIRNQLPAEPFVRRAYIIRFFGLTIVFFGLFPPQEFLLHHSASARLNVCYDAPIKRAKSSCLKPWAISSIADILGWYLMCAAHVSSRTGTSISSFAINQVRWPSSLQCYQTGYLPNEKEHDGLVQAIFTLKVLSASSFVSALRIQCHFVSRFDLCRTHEFSWDFCTDGYTFELWPVERELQWYKWVCWTFCQQFWVGCLSFFSIVSYLNFILWTNCSQL